MTPLTKEQLDELEALSAYCILPDEDRHALFDMARASLEPVPSESDRVRAQELSDEFNWRMEEKEQVEKAFAEIRAESQPKPTVTREEFEEIFGKEPTDKHDRFGTPDGRYREGAWDAYDYLASKTVVNLPSDEILIKMFKAANDLEKQKFFCYWPDATMGFNLACDLLAHELRKIRDANRYNTDTKSFETISTFHKGGEE